MQIITSEVLHTHSYGPKVKYLLFVIFIIVVVSLYCFSQHNNLFTPQTLKEIINSAGHLKPALFIISYAFGVCLFIPAILFSAVGAMLFGVTFGFFYNMAGAMLGASMAFIISRYLGRHLLLSVLPRRLSKFLNILFEDGFATTLYLRLVCFPFTYLSFGMGLTQVRFTHYFWGTFFGKFTSGLIITFFFATLKEVLVNGRLELLFDWKSLFACALFVGSFYIPRLLRSVKLDINFKQTSIILNKTSFEQ